MSRQSTYTPANNMVPDSGPKQPSAFTSRRFQTQYHGDRNRLLSYYNTTGNPNLYTTVRGPHPLSQTQTWTLPNMERKTFPKSTPPTTTISSSIKDALKSKPLSSQKSPPTAKVLVAPGKKYSKVEELDLLKQASSKISQLASTTLPAIAHVLSVQTEQDICPRYSLDESGHRLFSRQDFKTFQYMTLIDCTERGIISVEAGWAAEEKAISPASSAEKISGTPNGETEGKKTEFKRKIKFGDYAKVGKIVTTQSSAVTVMEHQLPPKPAVLKDDRGGLIPSKQSSAIKESASSGSKVTSAHINPDVKAAISSDKLSKTHTDSTFPEAFKPTTNVSQLSAPTKSSSQTPTSNSKVTSNGADRTAPKPTNSSLQKPSSKRPLPDDESSPPTKKAKTTASDLVANGSRAKKSVVDDHSSSQVTKKSELSNGIHSRDESSKAVRQPQDNGKKETGLKNKSQMGVDGSGRSPAIPKSSTVDNSKSTPPKSAAAKLPPLLSPTLPPQVAAANGHIEPVTLNSNPVKMSSNLEAPKLPKPEFEETSTSKSEAESSKSRSKLRIPPLLSPKLPPEVEAALAARNAREAAKEASSGEKNVAAPKKPVDSVADRHEKSRQPNAPGIARKVVKNGKNRQENSASTPAMDSASNPTTEPVKEQKPSALVKLKYKKRQKKDIERILKLRADPSAYDHHLTSDSSKNIPEESNKAKGERRNSQDKTKANERVAANERNGAVKRPPPASSTSQKRPRQEEPQQANNKRLKPSEPPQSSKPSTPNTPALKPPTISTPSSSQKPILDTPKKGDSLKSTAMMKVNSTDGNARTPQQATQASLPGSAEKPSTLPRNGSGENHRMPLPQLAVKLKREMDRLHQIKSGGVNNVTQADRKLGFVVGFECSLAYMASFEAQDLSLANKPQATKNWDDLLRLHSYIDRAAGEIPIFDVLSLHIKIITRHRLGNAFASTGLKGVDLAAVSNNIITQEKLWNELDHKMSSEAAQSIEESTSRTKKGFNPGGNFKHFMATSLRKLKLYAENEGIRWEQTLVISD